MKKILLTLIIYLLSSSVSIANENDCSGIKKLSKDYLVCKAKSIKDSANNVNNKIKEGSVNKTKQITEGTKNIFNNIKNKINKN
tara:strand:- start:291 stop:542 length:252 start_codon:yes stop_codon:yes gene_type:complete